MKPNALRVFAALLITAGVFSFGTPAKAQAAPASRTLAQRAPRLILILRHAEKSPDEKDPDLTPTGRERAEKIPSLFDTTNGHPPRFLHPDFLFAAAPSKKSNRPAETIAPLGRALNEHVNLDFDRDDDAGLAREVLSGKYAGKVVLIIWHHKTIPTLAHDFGIANPPSWSDETYDQVWEIDFNDGSAHLTTASEKLMTGDSNQ